MNNSITESNMSDTQLKKLFRSFLTGNDQSLQWHEVLKHLADMPDARQKAALRRLELGAFMTIMDNIKSVYESHRKQEIEDQRNFINKVKAFKEHMAAEGITLEDLKSVPSIGMLQAPISEIGLSEKESSILEEMALSAGEDLVYRNGVRPIAEKLGQENHWVSNGLSKLKNKGKIEADETRGHWKIL